MIGMSAQSYAAAVGARENLTEKACFVKTSCGLPDRRRPRRNGLTFRAPIIFVTDRPGHDRRNETNGRKLEPDLGWTLPETQFAGSLSGGRR